MVNIVVAGLPKAVKLPKFLNFLVKVVFKAHREFIINYTKPIHNGLKQISFNMKSNDAQKALRFLCNYQYKHANKPYRLQCWMEEERVGSDVDMYNNDIDEPMRQNYGGGFDHYEPPRKNRRYSRSPMRSGSRSPYHSSELREIETKIELVRKQRILMEEETKLLMEKRKLEYLQNIGTNDYSQLTMFEDICKRNDPNEVSDFVETLQPRTIKKKPITGGKLPNFLGPCKEINSQMHSMIRTHPDIDDYNRSFFWKLLRSTLKKRLAVVLEGMGYLSTSNIVALYREKHPQTTDKALVDELINTISMSCWPRMNKGKKVETAIAIHEGQKNESENPGAEIKELIKRDNPPKLVESDEIVDLDNDVENWEDEVTDLDNIDNDCEELSKDQAEVPQPEEENNDDLVAQEENNVENNDDLVAQVENNVENNDDLGAEEENNVLDEIRDVDAEDDMEELENVIFDEVGVTEEKDDDQIVKQETDELKKEGELAQ